MSVMSSREIADFFNQTYRSKFKDIDFAKPSATTARRVFNILVSSVCKIKKTAKNNRALYTRVLTRTMFALGFKDFDALNDIAFVDKTRFIQMCCAIVDYLKEAEKFKEEKKQILADLRNTQSDVESKEKTLKEQKEEVERLTSLQAAQQPIVDKYNGSIIALTEKVTNVKKEKYSVEETTTQTLESISQCAKDTAATVENIKKCDEYITFAQKVIEATNNLNKINGEICAQTNQAGRLQSELERTKEEKTLTEANNQMYILCEGVLRQCENVYQRHVAASQSAETKGTTLKETQRTFDKAIETQKDIKRKRDTAESECLKTEEMAKEVITNGGAEERRYTNENESVQKLTLQVESDIKSFTEKIQQLKDLCVDEEQQINLLKVTHIRICKTVSDKVLELKNLGSSAKTKDTPQLPKSVF
ncbi:hypothetical protein EIN_379800 [Entamoeba invadens IP1]|uniref:Uncharacterized protein n=1 Tax=Entamoeba invadens IP1 TaxID=370355 RepID=A0A0A1UAK0_ENTIV|nr:hypothetical protein EIN_379800 [Entamoeba invadens IP1]ELP92093.1 hypothetical protein EIN_379800 [Entamoeba invadens IP1]|eukprot:XP_004258864.1 hypothetical protein EIN_379800 [Entamoeba invadens IP1]